MNLEKLLGLYFMSKELSDYLKLDDNRDNPSAIGRDIKNLAVAGIFIKGPNGVASKEAEIVAEVIMDLLVYIKTYKLHNPIEMFKELYGSDPEVRRFYESKNVDDLYCWFVKKYQEHLEDIDL